MYAVVAMQLQSVCNKTPILVITILSCECGSITCGNPLNVVEESDNEDEL